MPLAFFATHSLVERLAAAEPRAAPARGTYELVAPESREGSAAVSHLLFVERCDGGCALMPGPNDARANTTPLIDAPIMLSEFAHGDTVWGETIECLQSVYAPYDVEITTSDPGADANHHKAILAGSSAEAGRGPGVGGVAPLASDCSPIDNAISLSFANSMGPDWQLLCWTIAQESAHAFGLEHAFDCHDVMTYLEGCGTKYFRDEDVACGEYTEMPCQCGGPSQNSHEKLLAVFGEGTLPAPPQVILEEPEDASPVEDGFRVVATAQHERGIDRFELRLNGWVWSTSAGTFNQESQVFAYTTPPALPDGYIDVELIAYNDLGVSATRESTVLKGSPCTAEAQCAQGQACEDGRCRWPPPSTELGDRCDINQECLSLLCTENAGEQRCSEGCFPGETESCPVGFECVPGGESGTCWPAGGDVGCCSTGRQGGPWPAALYFAVLAFTLRGRGRRSVAR